MLNRKRSIFYETFPKIFEIVVELFLHRPSREMRSGIGHESCLTRNRRRDSGDIGESTEYLRIRSDEIVIDRIKKSVTIEPSNNRENSFYIRITKCIV